jgi:hypothetical protein
MSVIGTFVCTVARRYQLQVPTTHLSKSGHAKQQPVSSVGPPLAHSVQPSKLSRFGRTLAEAATQLLADLHSSTAIITAGWQPSNGQGIISRTAGGSGVPACKKA